MNGGRRGTAPALSSMAVLVLGLLAERPMHPYEMVQTTIHRREDRLVKFRPGTLYHAVDRLAADELIAVHEVRREGNRPERTVYVITDAGRAALEANLEEILGRHPAEYPELYLALAEAHGLPRRRVIELLTTRLQAMRADLAAITAATALADADGTPEMFFLDAGCRIATMRAQTEWLADLLDRLREGRIDWLDDPGFSYQASVPRAPSIPAAKSSADKSSADKSTAAKSTTEKESTR